MSLSSIASSATSSYDTQSDETSNTYPSTDKQLVLLRDLVARAAALGLADAAVDEHGYVMATHPGDDRQSRTCRRSASSRTSTRRPR